MNDDGHAILIGGIFHRQKVEVRRHQMVVTMRIPPKLPCFNEKVTFDNHDTKVEEYINFTFYFGDHTMDNIYFIKGIDPMLTLFNIIKDYMR